MIQIQRPFSPETAPVIFLGGFIRVKLYAIEGDWDKGAYTHIEEVGTGNDISHLVRIIQVVKTMKKEWLEMELNLPGFDGPFCTPGLDLTL